MRKRCYYSIARAWYDERINAASRRITPAASVLLSGGLLFDQIKGDHQGALLGELDHGDLCGLIGGGGDDHRKWLAAGARILDLGRCPALIGKGLLVEAHNICLAGV